MPFQYVVVWTPKVKKFQYHDTKIPLFQAFFCVFTMKYHNCASFTLINMKNQCYSKCQTNFPYNLFHVSQIIKEKFLRYRIFFQNNCWLQTKWMSTIKKFATFRHIANVLPKILTFKVVCVTFQPKKIQYHDTKIHFLD